MRILTWNTRGSSDQRKVDELAGIIDFWLQDKDEDVAKNALIAIYNLDGRNILDEVLSLPVYNEFLKTEAQNIIDEYESEEECDVRKRL